MARIHELEEENKRKSVLIESLSADIKSKNEQMASIINAVNVALADTIAKQVDIWQDTFTLLGHF